MIVEVTFGNKVEPSEIKQILCPEQRRIQMKLKNCRPASSYGLTRRMPDQTRIIS